MLFLARHFPAGKTILASFFSSSQMAMQFLYFCEQVDPKA
jgi:hypothetical protein